jgi:hypothetical protein
MGDRPYLEPSGQIDLIDRKYYIIFSKKDKKALILCFI